MEDVADRYIRWRLGVHGVTFSPFQMYLVDQFSAYQKGILPANQNGGLASQNPRLLDLFRLMDRRERTEVKTVG